MTPAELAGAMFGWQERYSRSAGARRVRRIARKLYPELAPGKGGEWNLTSEMVYKIQRTIDYG